MSFLSNAIGLSVIVVAIVLVPLRGAVADDLLDKASFTLEQDVLSYSLDSQRGLVVALARPADGGPRALYLLEIDQAERQLVVKKTFEDADAILLRPSGVGVVLVRQTTGVLEVRDRRGLIERTITWDLPGTFTDTKISSDGLFLAATVVGEAEGGITSTIVVLHLLNGTSHILEAGWAPFFGRRSSQVYFSTGDRDLSNRSGASILRSVDLASMEGATLRTQSPPILWLDISCDGSFFAGISSSGNESHVVIQDSATWQVTRIGQADRESFAPACAPVNPDIVVFRERENVRASLGTDTEQTLMMWVRETPASLHTLTRSASSRPWTASWSVAENKFSWIEQGAPPRLIITSIATANCGESTTDCQ
jgi:hypothetical protein